MTNEEAVRDIRDNIKPICGGKSLDMAINVPETIDRITAERDAAVAELEHFKKAFKSQVEGTRGVYHCDACKYGGDYLNRDDIGKKCPKGCDGYNKWEWGGAQNDS